MHREDEESGHGQLSTRLDSSPTNRDNTQFQHDGLLGYGGCVTKFSWFGRIQRTSAAKTVPTDVYGGSLAGQ